MSADVRLVTEPLLSLARVRRLVKAEVRHATECKHVDGRGEALPREADEGCRNHTSMVELKGASTAKFTGGGCKEAAEANGLDE